jgi:hypothetical protein
MKDEEKSEEQLLDEMAQLHQTLAKPNEAIFGIPKHN